MAAFIFDKQLADSVRAGQIPARTASSRRWFRNKGKAFSVSPNRMMGADKSRLTTSLAPGEMGMFFYDAKHKKTLPYFDRFPMIFKIENVQGGFTGLNLHYLPLPLRAKLMDALYDITTNTKFDETTKLRLNYETLRGAAKFGPFKPTFKMYLNKQVRSRFLNINSVEWDLALFMPLERFDGSNKQQVWRDSRKAISG